MIEPCPGCGDTDPAHRHTVAHPIRLSSANMSVPKEDQSYFNQAFKDAVLKLDTGALDMTKITHLRVVGTALMAYRAPDDEITCDLMAIAANTPKDAWYKLGKITIQGFTFKSTKSGKCTCAQCGHDTVSVSWALQGLDMVTGNADEFLDQFIDASAHVMMDNMTHAEFNEVASGDGAAGFMSIALGSPKDSVEIPFTALNKDGKKVFRGRALMRGYRRA